MAKGRSKMPSQRQLRVGELVRHALTTVLQRGEARDPALQRVVLSVSEVSMSPDLKHATAYINALGQTPEQEAGTIEALNGEATHLRHRLTPHLNHMKTMPALRFRADTSFDNFATIDAILRRPEVQRDLDHRDEE